MVAKVEKCSHCNYFYDFFLSRSFLYRWKKKKTYKKQKDSAPKVELRAEKNGSPKSLDAFVKTVSFELIQESTRQQGGGWTG